MGEFHIQMPTMRDSADSTELQAPAYRNVVPLRSGMKVELHHSGTTASSTKLGQLSKSQCNVLGTQMSVSLQHLHRLVPGDGGDFHDVQSALN